MISRFLCLFFCCSFSSVFAAGNPNLFKSILLEPSQKEALTLIVELQRGTMSLIKTKGEQIDVVEQLPVSIGKNGYGKLVEGDKRTPVGIYDINSFIADSDLPERYGVGAFTLDYPNFIDRKDKRTGSGIWIHGIDRKLGSRPFLDSDGCVVIDNEQFNHLKPFLNKRPTVVLVDDLPQVNTELTRELKEAMLDWEGAWESLNVNNYLDFYSPEFDNGKKNYETWVAHKQRVGKAKTFIEVDISDVAMLLYPHKDEIVRIEFNQKYKSNNFNGSDIKRQYWHKDENNEWKIIYEASI